jgi:hypothetical protein
MFGHIKKMFGRRIGLRKDVGKIVAFASYGMKYKNRPPTFSSIADSLLECCPS